MFLILFSFYTLYPKYSTFLGLFKVAIKRDNCGVARSLSVREFKKMNKLTVEITCSAMFTWDLH